MNFDLFNADLFSNQPRQWQEPFGPGAVVLRGFAQDCEVALIAALNQVMALAPVRQMLTPGGLRMSVAMTNCGAYGWVSDQRGYRYQPIDPMSDQPWPDMPIVFLKLAQRAAQTAGFIDFAPDACLINLYLPGTRLSLHQDKNERDFSQPIVSVSLGLPATFIFGGLQRRDPVMRVPLTHGDVVVWGGPARLRYHGVSPLKTGRHPLLGEQRINLTFRVAR